MLITRLPLFTALIASAGMLSACTSGPDASKIVHFPTGIEQFYEGFSRSSFEHYSH